MNDRIVCNEENIKLNFMALEMEQDGSEYCVSVDGEVIVWNDNVEIAEDNYRIIKENIINKRYVREGLVGA